MKGPLPDPCWADAPSMCIACGYPLAGLPAPGVCPECGSHSESRHLVLCGVPRRSVTSPYRRAAWIILLVVAVAFSQTFPLIIIYLKWWTAVGVLGAIVGMAALLLATGPRERRGSERFIIAPSGIARIPIAAAPGGERPQGAWTPWGDAHAAELRRVSSNWRRLRIGRRGPGAKLTGVIFDAGVRCPDASAGEVLATIESYLGRSAP